MHRTIKVYEGENFRIDAKCYDDGMVRLELCRPYLRYGRPYSELITLWHAELDPKPRRWWRPCRQKSIGEQVQRAMQELERREFMLKESEVKIKAAQDSIRVLVDLERELEGG